MELRQLKYFVAVARTLNFTEAARQLYITQGTLSQQLRQLEYELGTTLFERSSRNVSLTEAGGTLLPLAQQMLEVSDLCTTKMRDLRNGIGGMLRIGVSSSMRSFVNSCCRRYVDKYPEVTLHISTGSTMEMLEKLRANEFDLVVSLCQQEADPALVSTILFRTQLAAIMDKNHILADRKSVSFNDLSRFRLILPGGGPHVREMFQSFFNVNLGSRKHCISSNELDTILELVRCSDRVALLTASDVATRKDFVAVPLIIGEGNESESREIVCCIHRLASSYRKRSTAAFVDLLTDEAHIANICSSLNF